jgi:flagellar M-ring protein FliF
MLRSDYWGALSTRQRSGIFAGVILIVAVTVALALWLLRDPHVTVAAGLDSSRLNELVQQLDRAKVEYRVAEHGDAVTVPRSQLGRAHAAAGAGALDVPASVGLELFKESEFSTTDLAQRINYQRALQGELTRTIQALDGVRSARVHVILPDRGLFKRDSARATAAVSLSLHQGRIFTRAQVQGIQRLVAAAVPGIEVDNVIILDDSGATLTRAAAQADGDLSSAQLDLKRQADQYLESKLTRLLQEVVPDGVAALSVDTTLDERQLRVTTEEPIAAGGPKSADRAAGVLVKERQSQRGSVPGLMQADAYSTESGGADWEYEYRVGSRMEQTLSAPGSIKRVSVAVALQGAPAELTRQAVEDLLAHAVGVDRSRGDSVSVLLLPGPGSVSTDSGRVEHSAPAAQAPTARAPRGQSEVHGPVELPESTLAAVMLLAALIVAALWWRRTRGSRGDAGGPVDEEAVIVSVKQWLNAGVGHGRG